jgi:hypothetical protein
VRGHAVVGEQGVQEKNLYKVCANEVG